MTNNINGDSGVGSYQATETTKSYISEDQLKAEKSINLILMDVSYLKKGMHKKLIPQMFLCKKQRALFECIVDYFKSTGNGLEKHHISLLYQKTDGKRFFNCLTAYTEAISQAIPLCEYSSIETYIQLLRTNYLTRDFNRIIKLSSEIPDVEEMLKVIRDQITDLTQVVSCSNNMFPKIEQLTKTEVVNDLGEQFIWQDILAQGSIIQFCAPWKSGKTTFITSLAYAISKGLPFGKETHQSDVLILSEESGSRWVNKLNNLGLDDDNMYIMPSTSFHGLNRKFDLDMWVDLINYVVMQCKEKGIKLCIIDTLIRFSPCKNENDAGEMSELLAPFEAFRKHNISCIFAHHSPKSNTRNIGAPISGRGSGVISSFTDANWEFKTNMNMGTLSWEGRDGKGEMNFEFKNDKYVYSGVPIQPADARKQCVLDCLHKSKKWMTTKEIHNYILVNEKIAFCTVQNCLKSLVNKITSRKRNGRDLEWQTKAFAENESLGL